jgi:hypothetical protein
VVVLDAVAKLVPVPLPDVSDWSIEDDVDIPENSAMAIAI